MSHTHTTPGRVAGGGAGGAGQIFLPTARKYSTNIRS